MKRIDGVITINKDVNTLTRSIVFETYQKEVLDIDVILTITNKTFANELDNLGLGLNFNFKDKNIKQIYTHCFIKSIFEYFKSNQYHNKVYFFNNKTTKDDFRNRLINKVKTIFGLSVFESTESLDVYVDYFNEQSSEFDNLFLFVEENRKPKTLKYIKKYLNNIGLIGLKDCYFEDTVNKLIALV